MKSKKMTKLTLFFVATLVPFCGISQPAIGEEGFSVIKEAYLYDKLLPLNPLVIKSKEYDSYTRHEIYFTGVRERVGAYLAIPKVGKAPFPVVLLIDGMGGSKERWWGNDNWPNGLETTEALLKNGFAVFTIDAAMHGKRGANPEIFPKPLSLRKENLMNTTRNLIKQTAQDYMRGLDYLQTRSDIAIEKVGVYGLSMGGAVTFILTGLDKRVDTAVAGVAVVYGNKNSVVNAYNFTSRITDKPFLMIMGDSDGFYTPKTAAQLFSSIGGKQNHLILFKGGHKVPVSYIPVIVEWMEQGLARVKE